MADNLCMNAINSLPHPLMAEMYRDRWPIYDIDVETGLMRIDVCGMLEIKHFGEVQKIIDADGIEHDAECFWTDYEHAKGEQ